MRTGLVERDGELAALADAINRRAAAGSLVMVEGAAGIGKTALLDEAARLGTKARATVLRARGAELERQFSFGLVRQLFEPLLARADDQERAGWLSGAAGVAEAVLGRGGSTPLGDFAVLHGLFTLTANVSKTHPLVLVVDDLHCADRGSLRYLAHLLPRLADLPLTVVGATRPVEPGAEQRLIALLACDPAAVVLRPQALSASASALLLSLEMGAPAELTFAAACQLTTGGNPLLLKILARAAAKENMSPVAANITRVARLGATTLSRRVGVWLADMPVEAATLARAVAILGDGAPLSLAGALAGLDPERAAVAAEQLERSQILHAAGPGNSGPLLAFVHPLVHAAVYEQMGAAARMKGHAAAARLLKEQVGAEPDRVATHLLRIPAVGEVWVTDMLRRAAADAARRGAAETAVAYLDRCVQEPLHDAERLDVLVELGHAAMLVDTAKAAQHLGTAWDLATDIPQRALLADAFGIALIFSGQPERAIEVCQQALAELDAAGTQDVDLRRRLQADLMSVTIHDPAARVLLSDLADRCRDLPDDAGPGSRMLDGMIAMQDALVLVTPSAADRALRCVADPAILGQASAMFAVDDAIWVLAAADRPEAMTTVETLIRRVCQDGSLLGLAVARCLRSLIGLWRGSLGEAESDAREVLRTGELAQLHTVRPFAAAFLADVLIERGRLDEAEEALTAAGSPDSGSAETHQPWLPDSLARLMLARGRVEEGVAEILRCGAQYSAHGWRNPAFLAWRSTAALGLHTLDRRDEACHYAEEELALARQWGAPRALGRALRVAGLVRGGQDGPLLLQEAVQVLEGSPAALEYAKALVDLGAAVRRAGQRSDGKRHLALGLDVAHRCGATPLAERAEMELRVLGARLRRPRLTGPDALTPSEFRVAELAAKGLTNRDIAQRLFLNIKTVEVHLGSVYRKLGIARRAQLARQLPDTTR